MPFRVWGCLFVLLMPGAASAADGLESRYNQLSCAVGRIESDAETGSGVFIDNKGHLLTASHVLYSRHWFWDKDKVSLRLERQTNLKIVMPIEGSKPFDIPDPTNIDAENAQNDLAVIDTKINNGCFIPLDTTESQSIGQHLISIGYPNGNPTQVLYDGFVSSIHQHWPVPLGPLEQSPKPGIYILAKYDVLRVQMPLTPGASGSPIINDQNKVIAVVSEAPIILANDIAQIIQAYAYSGQSSGTMISGFDTNKILGELAGLVVNYQSPGAGFAVQVKYLHGVPHYDAPK